MKTIDVNFEITVANSEDKDEIIKNVNALLDLLQYKTSAAKITYKRVEADWGYEDFYKRNCEISQYTAERKQTLNGAERPLHWVKASQ